MHLLRQFGAASSKYPLKPGQTPDLCNVLQTVVYTRQTLLHSSLAILATLTRASSHRFLDLTHDESSRLVEVYHLDTYTYIIRRIFHRF